MNPTAHIFDDSYADILSRIAPMATLTLLILPLDELYIPLYNTKYILCMPTLVLAYDHESLFLVDLRKRGELDCQRREGIQHQEKSDSQQKKSCRNETIQ